MADKRLVRFEREIEQAERTDNTQALRKTLSALAPYLLTKGAVSEALVQFTRVKALKLLPGA